MTFKPTIYNRNQAPGQLWARDITSKTEHATSIHRVLSSFGPTSSGSLLTGIKTFDVLYDTGVIVVPENVFLFKINTDYNTGRIFTTTDEVRVISLEQSSYVGTWFFPQSQSVTICKLVSCEQGAGSQIRPVLYELDLDSFELTFLYNLTSRETQYYYEFTNIDSSTITYDYKTQIYNVSFTAYAKCNSGMYLCTLNIEKINNAYEIVSSKVIEPVDAYICSNLENSIAPNSSVCKDLPTGFVATTIPYCNDISCTPIDRYEWYINDTLQSTAYTDQLINIFEYNFTSTGYYNIMVKTYDTLDRMTSATLVTNVEECATYDIFPESNNVNEGSSIDFLIETQYVPDTTVLYWCLYFENNATADDFDPSTLYGNVTISYNQARFTVNVARDEILDDNEMFGAYLLSEPHTDPLTPPNEAFILASTINNEVTINDVGFNNLSITLQADEPIVCANTDITFTATTSAFCTEDLICTPISRYVWSVNGQIVHTDTSLQTQLSLIRQFAAYGTHTVSVTVYDENERQASAQVIVSVIDCRSYTIYPEQRQVNEGGTVNFIVETENIPTGTRLYWTIYMGVGVNSADFTSTPYGSITINNNRAVIPISITLDTEIENDEQFGMYLLSSSNSTTTPPQDIILADTIGDEVTIINVNPTITESFVLDKTFTDEILKNNFIKNATTQNLSKNFIDDCELQNTNSITNVVYLPTTGGKLVAKIKISDLSKAAQPSGVIEEIAQYVITDHAAGNPSRTVVLPDHNYSVLVACRGTNEVVYIDNNERGNFIPGVYQTPGANTSNGAAWPYGKDIAHKFTIFVKNDDTVTILTSGLDTRAADYRVLNGGLSTGVRAIARTPEKDLYINVQSYNKWYKVPAELIENAINNGTEYIDYQVTTSQSGHPSRTKAYGATSNAENYVWSIDHETKYINITKDNKCLSIDQPTSPIHKYGISTHESRFILIGSQSINSDGIIIIDSLCPTLLNYIYNELFDPNITNTSKVVAFTAFTGAIAAKINTQGYASSNGLGNTGILYPPASSGTYDYKPVKLLPTGDADIRYVIVLPNGRIRASGGSSEISYVENYLLVNNRDSNSLMFGPDTANVERITPTLKTSTGAVYTGPGSTGHGKTGIASVTDDYGNTGLVVPSQTSSKILVIVDNLDGSNPGSNPIPYYEHSIPFTTYNYTNFTGYEILDDDANTGTLSFTIQPVELESANPVITWADLTVTVKRNPSTPTSMPANFTVIATAQDTPYTQSFNLAGLSEGTISFAGIFSSNQIVDDSLRVSITITRDTDQAVNEEPETIYIDRITATFDYI